MLTVRLQRFGETPGRSAGCQAAGYRAEGRASAPDFYRLIYIARSTPLNHTAASPQQNDWQDDWGEGLETLKVSGKSRPNAVAGAIAALLRSQGEVEVQAIGPAAVNQAVKAIAIARGYIIPENLDLHTQPAFVKLDIDDEERTAVRFAVRGFKLS